MRAWLFLGDVATRAGRLGCGVAPGDIVLLAGTRPMLRTGEEWADVFTAPVEFLSDEKLGEHCLDAAFDIVDAQVAEIENLSHDRSYAESPWSAFAVSYLIFSLTQYAAGTIALRNWLCRVRPTEVIVVRHLQRLTAADFSDPVRGGGPDNVLSFAAARICADLEIPYRIHYQQTWRRFERYTRVVMKGQLVSWLRALRLPAVGQLVRWSASPPLRTGGVVFALTARRYVDACEGLMTSCPVSLVPQVLYFKTLTATGRGLESTLPILRMEAFSRWSDVAQLFMGYFGGIRRARLAELRIRNEPLADGFTAEYLRRMAPHARFTRLYQQCAKRALRTLKPSLIIGADDPGPATNTIIKEARTLQIPVVTVQHGEYIAPAATIFTMPDADLMLVRSEPVRQFFIARGRPTARVACYSSPQLSVQLRDPIHDLAEPKVLIAATAYGNKLSTPIFLHVVASLLRQQPKLRITLRLHPSEQEDPAEYRRAFAERNLDVEILSKSEPLALHLAGVHCALIIQSSVGFHTAMAGTPTVVWIGNGWVPLSYLDEPYEVAYSLEDAVYKVLEYLTPAKRGTFFKKYGAYYERMRQGRYAPDGRDWWTFLIQRYGLSQPASPVSMDVPVAETSEC
jgi:hypothetical protein